MAVSRLRSYARALNWTLKDMQEATGLDFGVPADEPNWTLAGTGNSPRRYLALDGAIQAELVIIPVYAIAAAGKGVYVEERDAIGYVEVAREIARHPHRATFAIEGDSMEPTVSHGDVVHVDRSDIDLRDDKIYLVEIEGSGYVVKRAREYGNTVWFLVSDNPEFRLCLEWMRV